MKRLLRRLFRFRRKDDSGYYYSRDYYYEVSLDKYYNVETYLHYLDNSTKSPTKTDQEIVFSTNDLFLDEPRKYLKRKYGRPNYNISHKFPFGNVDIYFYKIFLGTQKARLELHFFENRLFFYNYTFTYLKNDEEKNQILNVLTQKYSLQKRLKPDSEYIVDQMDNCIIVDDSISLIINYLFSTKSEIYKQMKEYAESLSKEQQELKAKKERELYERL